MLQPDISTRISVSGIMSHPWFRKEMPPGAADMNDKYVARPRACEQTEADIMRIIEGAARQ
jgi:serine/threonine-protein kinase SRK2